VWVPQVVAERAIAVPLWHTLQRASVARPRDPRVWNALARLLEFAGGPTLRHAHYLQRERSTRTAGARAALPVGRVLSAAVYRFLGEPFGLFHEVWAARRRVEPGTGGSLERSDILGNVAPDMQTALRGTFLAVKEYARAHFPEATADVEDFGYQFKVTKEDETSSGSSAGLPTALAILSVMLDRGVPRTLGFTGRIINDAHDVLVVGAVGDIEAKAMGAVHLGLDRIVVPAENRAELEASHAIPPSVVRDVCVFAATLDDVVPLVFGPQLPR
jgi:hypothetical protein